MKQSTGTLEKPSKIKELTWLPNNKIILGATISISLFFSLNLLSEDIYKEKVGKEYVESSSYPVEASEWLLTYMKDNNIQNYHNFKYFATICQIMIKFVCIF